MEKIISVLLGMILFMKGIFWIKTGKSAIGCFMPYMRSCQCQNEKEEINKV